MARCSLSACLSLQAAILAFPMSQAVPPTDSHPLPPLCPTATWELPQTPSSSSSFLGRGEQFSPPGVEVAFVLGQRWLGSSWRGNRPPPAAGRGRWPRPPGRGGPGWGSGARRLVQMCHGHPSPGSIGGVSSNLELALCCCGPGSGGSPRCPVVCPAAVHLSHRSCAVSLLRVDSAAEGQPRAGWHSVLPEQGCWSRTQPQGQCFGGHGPLAAHSSF